MKTVLLKRGQAVSANVQIRRGPEAKDRRGRWTYQDCEFWRRHYGIGKRTWSRLCGLDSKSYERRLREPSRTLGLETYRTLRFNLYVSYGPLPLRERYRTI